MMFELFIARRYLRAKRKQVVISVITAISVVGVAAGVMALVIALAITNGLRSTLERNLLGSEVLLDGHRVVRAALDGSVVGDDDAGRALHSADAGDDAGARGVLVVEAVGGDVYCVCEVRGNVGARPVEVEERAAGE